jgi:hypothetical protein
MASNKLTDTQRVILATAAARETELVLPLAKSLGTNRGTHGIVLKSLLTRGLITERPIESGEEVWRNSEEVGRTTLVISELGLEAIGISATEVPERDGNQTPHGDETITVNSGSTDNRHERSIPDGAVSTLPKAGSKLDALVTALRRAEGATIADLMGATGWQAHSVRGGISGSLKKKLKLEVTSDMVEGRGRVYRIAEMVSE